LLAGRALRAPRPGPRCLAGASLPYSALLSACAVAQEYTAKLAALQAKGDDYEIAAAQIGVEVYSALNSAVAA